MFELIQRSKRISDITQGAFDISYGSIDKKLWNFDQNNDEFTGWSKQRKNLYA
jgi:thiamine biosynthesis lipoprotein